MMIHNWLHLPACLPARCHGQSLRLPFLPPLFFFYFSEAWQIYNQFSNPLVHVINLHKICTIFHSQPLEYDNDNEHDDDVDGDDASSRISQLPAKKKRIRRGEGE